MICIKCGKEIELRLASKVSAKGCKVLSSMTTIITIQCDNCNNILQIPLSNKSVISVNKE